jgi:hypothetical protein
LGGAFGFANCDHLFGMGAGQLAAAGEPAAFADAGKISADRVPGFSHCEDWCSVELCNVSGLRRKRRIRPEDKQGLGGSAETMNAEIWKI